MIWIWIGFVLLILSLLALDLGVLNRKAHVIGVKEAIGWSAFWISLGLLFSVFVYFGYQQHWLGLGRAADGTIAIDPVDKVKLEGHTATVKYLTGYVIEKSLSVDNIFVIALIFAYFRVPAMYQHRVLFWGIMGALLMRGAMIGIGSVLIARFHWILYLFGLFLIGTGIRMLFMGGDDDESPKENPVVKLARRLFPITQWYHGEHFVVRAGSQGSHEPPTPGTESLTDEAVTAARQGAIMLTPLALALVMVETTDLIFAVDSIPAIFAITGDPFIVFTSNVFAILGLRSLYFALAGMMDKFRYLKVSLAIILALVGVKMLIAEWLKSLIGDSFNFWLLGVIGFILGAGVVASALANRRDARNAAAAGAAPADPAK
ncbi:MAG: tellurite resistance protein TerC [Phycisphaerales bacterium]|jgi:tellurite resistance protein TerC|nr:tellurite resistance protein TerC [Phycisphaerales bacterium]